MGVQSLPYDLLLYDPLTTSPLKTPGVEVVYGREVEEETGGLWWSVEDLQGTRPTTCPTTTGVPHVPGQQWCLICQAVGYK